MGFQTMASQANGQQSHFQPSPLLRQPSWYSLTLDEVKNQLGDTGKPLGSMNLDELLQNIWTTEANQSIEMDIENTSSVSSLQRQASLTLARGLSGKTVDEVWREIQQGQKKRYGEDMKFQDTEITLGETTLEDFLVQAGLFAEGSLSPAIALDTIEVAVPQSYPHNLGLLSSPSFGTQSDTTTPGRKRDASDAYEKTIERRLRRKIKNRESAARSRARKQAYHNELVSKVSRLEEKNIKLKKEKEIEKMLPSELSAETKYQLRRISSHHQMAGQSCR
ncbi:PREDICTED: ABSCISIC ACID-INSENSITIVE 5-like protein 2 isoform X1 [Prunus mume]|uniref:ABSCISIC ACID-INSENSITIVE 5-like protein 2 isoform X1 n=1 Tax=Prunus mume TaxID=102107 RepID=A0ABM0NXC1_PRUMU|nr:PREDICTED: ABSCISIC ACID-INSENSITIVE 5-like protein 2 isoform X1 [Prunus mume]